MFSFSCRIKHETFSEDPKAATTTTLQQTKQQPKIKKEFQWKKERRKKKMINLTPWKIIFVLIIFCCRGGNGLDWFSRIRCAPQEDYTHPRSSLTKEKGVFHHLQSTDDKGRLKDWLTRCNFLMNSSMTVGLNAISLSLIYTYGKNHTFRHFRQSFQC